MTRQPDNPWPQWPIIMRSLAAHDEGGVRDYSIQTKSFSGSDGWVEKLHAVRLEWGPPDETGRPTMKEIPGSEFEIETELVLLAMGFIHPEHEGLLTDLDVELDARGNVATSGDHMSSVRGVFAAGDLRRGQSLVVWAIAEGREARTPHRQLPDGLHQAAPQPLRRAAIGSCHHVLRNCRFYPIGL